MSTALLGQKPPSAEAAARLKDKLGLWLVAASRRDAAGKVWDAHAPIQLQREPVELGQMAGAFPGTPAVLDALFANQDEEYLEAVALAKAFDHATRHGRLQADLPYIAYLPGAVYSVVEAPVRRGVAIDGRSPRSGRGAACCPPT